MLISGAFAVDEVVNRAGRGHIGVSAGRGTCGDIDRERGQHRAPEKVGAAVRFAVENRGSVQIATVCRILLDKIGNSCTGFGDGAETHIFIGEIGGSAGDNLIPVVRPISRMVCISFSFRGSLAAGAGLLYGATRLEYPFYALSCKSVAFVGIRCRARVSV